MTLLSLNAILLFAVPADSQGRHNSGTPGADTPSAHRRTQAASTGRVRVPEHCPGARDGLKHYRHVYTNARHAMGLEGAVPYVRYPCAATTRRAGEWRTRARVAVQDLAGWRHDYAWEDWMPRGSKWWRVASCETGYGRDPNWSHDSGTYVSAFGIYRPGYADDAHRVGNLSWDETKRRLGRLPTPREQYEAALSHYREHGGFSGWGCRGA